MLSWVLRRCVPVIAGVALAAGSPGAAEATVWLDGNESKLSAGMGVNNAAPYLVGVNYSGDQWWVTAWQQSDTGLVGSQDGHAEGEAIFHDPWDYNSMIPVPFTGSSLASLSYTAAHGSLHAYAGASAQVYPSSYTVSPPAGYTTPVQIDNPFLAGGFAGVGLSYTDEVVFTSATLPVGSIVDLEITLYHDSSVISTAGLGGGPPYPNHAYSSTAVSISAYDEVWNSFGSSISTTLRDESLGGTLIRDDADEVTYVLQVLVGGHLAISQSLQVWARAAADHTASTASSVADSSNTAAIYLRALTEGFEVESASGASYEYPVPEPGTALLAGAGLAILAWRRRGERPGLS